MVDFAPEYFREAKFLYNTEYIAEMFERNSIPCYYFELISIPPREFGGHNPGDADYQWGNLPSDEVQRDMDAVYHDESDPYIEELQGRQKELNGEKYFGRDYTSVENVHVVMTTEKVREETLSRFGLEHTENIEAVIFLKSQVDVDIGDYVQIPLHQEFDEKFVQDDGRVLPPSLFDPNNEIYQHWILYRVKNVQPDESGMLWVTVIQRVDKPKDGEKILF